MVNVSDLRPPRLSGGTGPVQPQDAKPAASDVAGIASPHIIDVEISPPVAARIEVDADPASIGADRFRYIRMRLRELWRGANLRTILITSPLPEDGKSTVALNLATSLAERGSRKVLLIEADLRHPVIIERLGITERPGLAAFLEGTESTSSICRLNPLGWHLLPAGSSNANSTELLQSQRLGDLVRTLTPHFDWILIDSPPTLPLTDALMLSQHTQATLLVVRAGSTPRVAVEETVRLLGPEKILGIVLNGALGVNKLYSKYQKYYSQK